MYVLSLIIFNDDDSYSPSGTLNQTRSKLISQTSKSQTLNLRHYNYSIKCRLLYGSYKGVIKREAVYKCTNKDYLPEA